MLLEALRETGITPPMRLGLVVTSGALVDYEIGIGHVVGKRPDLFKPDDLIVVMDYGDTEGGLVSVGEKSNLWLKISVTGKEGHAGNPDTAHNAFVAGAALAHGMTGLEKDFVQNALFTPPRVTITPTRTEDYSTGINHIPEKFVFYADIRVTPEYSIIPKPPTCRPCSAPRGVASPVFSGYRSVSDMVCASCSGRVR